MKDLKKDLAKEANLLFAYISSSYNRRLTMPDNFASRYTSASINNDVNVVLPEVIFHFPWLIGPADAISRLFSRNSLLQRKLYVAAAIFECSTLSADWLLPKNISYFRILSLCILACLRYALKFLLGIICFPLLSNTLKPLKNYADAD